MVLQRPLLLLLVMVLERPVLLLQLLLLRVALILLAVPVRVRLRLRLLLLLVVQVPRLAARVQQAAAEVGVVQHLEAGAVIGGGGWVLGHKGREQSAWTCGSSARDDMDWCTQPATKAKLGIILLLAPEIGKQHRGSNKRRAVKQAPSPAV